MNIFSPILEIIKFIAIFETTYFGLDSIVMLIKNRIEKNNINNIAFGQIWDCKTQTRGYYSYAVITNVRNKPFVEYRWYVRDLNGERIEIQGAKIVDRNTFISQYELL